MKHFIHVLLMCAFAFGLSACGSSSDPMAAAEGYWSALANRDVETARKYTTAASAGQVTIDENADEEEEIEYTFGEPVETENRVTIPTTLQVIGGHDPRTFAMETIVVREGDAWKVDAQQTMMSMMGGAMKQLLEGLGQSMKQGMEDMGKAMQQGMEEMNRAMQEQQAEQEAAQEP